MKTTKPEIDPANTEIQFKENLMNVKQKDNKEKGMFFIEMDNKMVAELTYIWENKNKIIIDHTEVDPILQGKGVGKLLVAKAVEFARENNIEIILLCPFAKRIIQGTPEFHDVLEN
jgi:predicted GNAT family acetyltransferase